MAKITLEDIMNLEGNKVPTDAKSYSTFVYGYPKTGKSTFVNDLYGEKVLFLATEHRHQAIAGAHVVNVDSWAEFLQVMKLIKKPEVQDKYDAICVDTVGRLESYCEQYTLSKLGIDDLSEAAWGSGFGEYNKQLEKGLSLIEKCGLTPVFISHAKQETKKVLLSEALEEEKGKDGATVSKDKKTGKEYVEYQKTTPDVKNRFFNMINRIADNILFLDLSVDGEGREDRKIFYRDTVDHLAGASYRHMVEYTELNPEAYKKAVEDAINAEGKNNTVDKGKEKMSDSSGQYDYEQLMSEIAELGKKLQADGKAEERNKVIEEVLGKGNKVKDTKPEQAEVLAVLVDKLKEIA